MKIASDVWCAIQIALAAGILMVANNASAQRPTVLSGAGDVAPVVDAYRKLLGDPNNGNTTGSQASGRREINWDGVPDDKAAPAFLPGDFFQGPRGQAHNAR